MNVAPMMYMFLRPTWSDRWPAKTTQMKPSIVWLMTPSRTKSREIPARRGVGEDPRTDDIAWRLLRQAQQCGQDDLLGLPLQHLEHRNALGALLVQDLLEHRRFHDAETDPQSDADHDGAEEERDAPAPDQELVAGIPTEEQHRAVRQEQSGRVRRIAAMRRGSHGSCWCAPTPSPAAPSRPIRRRRRCPGSGGSS